MSKNLSALWLPYTQMAKPFQTQTPSKTAGSTIQLKNGSNLIDGIASWWVACHGYNHPHILNEIEKQLATYAHVMLGGLIPEPTQRLANRLAALCPGELNHVFFSESGSVGVEVALKMAIQFWLNKGLAKKNTFVYFQHAYHGDTFGAMSVCDPVEGMHHLFAPLLAQHHMQVIPDTAEKMAAFEQFMQTHHSRLAGLIIEPLVQGAGGMKMHSPDVLAYIYDVCQRYQVLFIADEIFTAFYRTGSLFACEQANITPDIMCLSKALTGGTLPLAATVATTRIFEAFLSDDDEKCLMHGPTYMGHALACRAANASLDLFEKDNYSMKVQSIENHLNETLIAVENLPQVKAVRVKGAIGCIEMKRELSPYLEDLKSFFIEQGVWLRPFGNIIYCTPPLTISPVALHKISDTMQAATRQLKYLLCSL